MSLYDPIERHRAVEKQVTRQGLEGWERKYYRFRPARWYGGIVTADCVGCGLLCRFCWVRDSVMLHPADSGKYYTAERVADSLVSLARRFGFRQLRVSGGEPAIGSLHLLELLDHLGGKGLSFILETNGIPIAVEESYAEDLASFDFVHVRVSLKSCCEEGFSRVTGAKPEGFELQLQSLKRLVEAGVSCHASVMVSFDDEKSLESLNDKLEGINPNLKRELEIEELILYPHVVTRLCKYGLQHISGYEPSNIPKERI